MIRKNGKKEYHHNIPLNGIIVCKKKKKNIVVLVT